MNCKLQYQGCKRAAVTRVAVKGRRHAACSSCRNRAWLNAYEDQRRRGVHADRAAYPQPGYEWSLLPEKFPWGDSDGFDPRTDEMKRIQSARQRRGYEYDY